MELHRYGLAWSHNKLGELDLQTGHPQEALTRFASARDHMKTLLRGNAQSMEYRHFMGLLLANLGDSLLAARRGPEAIAAHHQAIEHQRLTYEKSPERYRDAMSHQYHHLHLAQKALGQWDEAESSLRSVRKFLTVPQEQTSVLLYNRACLEVLEGALIGRGRTDMSPAEQSSRRAVFDRAMELLRQAIASGYRNLAVMRNDTDLEPLCPRPDFQVLPQDLAFPAEPFAPDLREP